MIFSKDHNDRIMHFRLERKEEQVFGVRLNGESLARKLAKQNFVVTDPCPAAGHFEDAQRITFTTLESGFATGECRRLMPTLNSK